MLRRSVSDMIERFTGGNCKKRRGRRRRKRQRQRERTICYCDSGCIAVYFTRWTHSKQSPWSTMKEVYKTQYTNTKTMPFLWRLSSITICVPFYVRLSSMPLFCNKEDTRKWYLSVDFPTDFLYTHRNRAYYTLPYIGSVIGGVQPKIVLQCIMQDYN